MSTIIEETTVDTTPAHEVCILVSGNNAGWRRSAENRDCALAFVLRELDPFVQGAPVIWPKWLRSAA